MQAGGCFVSGGSSCSETTDSIEPYVSSPHNHNFADPIATEMSLSKLVPMAIASLLIASTAGTEDNAQIKPNHSTIVSVEQCTSN